MYFDIWFMLEMRNDKFREFPIMPDRRNIGWDEYNIRYWFKYWFGQYKDEIENESEDEVDEYEIEIENEIEVIESEIENEIEVIESEIENEIEVIKNEIENEEITKQFSGEVDEEVTEVISCKVCLINTPKVVFTSCCHCACFSCANKLIDCHICRKKISRKIKLFL